MPAPAGPWEMQNSTTKASLRGIHAVGGGVAWASGTNGTVLRTEDGGYMWQSCAMPPGAAKLDFRGVWAWDANTAVVMSSGSGDLSRLYKTTDGCSSWKLLYTNPDKDGFWDAVAFRDPYQALILGDPVDGKFKVFRASLFREGQALGASGPVEFDAKGSAAFAASNSALALGTSKARPEYVEMWLGIGGRAGARVLAHRIHFLDTTDMAVSHWTVSSVPLASGSDSSGVFSLAFRDKNHGVAVGGDYKKPDEGQGTAAYTSDGGKSWTAAAAPPHGYRSAVAWNPGDKTHPGYWIAVGTNGSDMSYDDGKTWQYLDSGNWNALSLPWVVGPEGRIAKLVSWNPEEKSSR
jgi:photosystem II stability/assembly factor-like uncharacterized protein